MRQYNVGERSWVKSRKCFRLPYVLAATLLAAVSFVLLQLYVFNNANPLQRAKLLRYIFHNGQVSEKANILEMRQNVSILYSYHVPDRTYPIQPNVCPQDGKHPYLVLFIPSRPGNSRDRAAVRETWGLHARLCNIRIVFGFGLIRSPETQHDAYVENSVYGDLMQTGNVLDAYRNQTQLVLAFFQWGVTNCHNSRFIGKADEDAWINIHELVKYLQMPLAPYSITGHFIDDAPVYRDPDHKWYLSEEEYPNATYPKFPLGQLYVFPTALIPEVLAAAQSVRCVWLDDVCFGGQIPELLQLLYLDIPARGNWSVVSSVNCSDPRMSDTYASRFNCNCPGRDYVIIDQTPAEVKRKIFYDPCMSMYRQYSCPNLMAFPEITNL
ncbi:UDP-GalNAc:beta-1,3-N-acetylgalactosaminyltransferase 1-like [Paramacrobiotus metropolitanus]|uniref:UDP-GalNAc:beta-1, 3-N-acetylgalactosaminyltransferase 1-like n=1 Tax=Paramacrobiotus metropolitanus TaxID=2943436 RepID=UPI002445CFAA|nr:UDP-GalNAc:beta-1,3-N-acetylgalactosaminyltransferase 1-like [Paramacrobiotus metropolitanus]